MINKSKENKKEIDSYTFQNELMKEISISDILTTGLPEGNLEIEQGIENTREKYLKNLKKWILIAGPITLGYFAVCTYTVFTRDYYSDVYQATPYLYAGAVLTNMIYGIKSGVSHGKLNSLKRIHEIGKSIEERLLER